jgi:putative ABC transport system permease protein
MPDASRREWARALERRLAALGVAPTRRHEIIAEVGQHLADASRDTLDPREADRLVRELAGIERSVSLEPPVLGKARPHIMSSIWQDLRYALRSLRLNPAYTTIVLATLALGIGANAAIFSVADAVMLRPFPYPDMNRIIAMTENTREGQLMSVAYPNFQDWLAQNQSFEHLGLFRGTIANLTGGDQPERLSVAYASSGVFATMGVPPALGRALTAAEDKEGSSRVVVISERLWRSRFNGDPGVLGRAIVLNNEPYEIVGVMPPGMRYPSRLTDAWLPFGILVPTLPKSRGAHPGLSAIGKLRPGVTFNQAVADMNTVAARLSAQYRDTNQGNGIQMTPYYEQVVRTIRPTLYMLLGAVGFVLLIGCANLANLMLARAERRQREIAVRAALGAERRRVIQQLLTESLLLALVGGTLGVLLATWIVKLFVASRPVSIPRIDLVGVDVRVIAFAAALSIVTGIVFGLMPALRASSPDLVGTLKQTGRGAGGGRSRRFRSILVVVEVAMAVVLLVGAGLMIRSFAKLTAIETGFDPEGVVTLRLTLPASKYRELDRWLGFHDQMVQKVSAIPGVTAAGVNSAVPLEGGGSEAPVFVEGRPLPSPGNPIRDAQPTLFQASSPGYLPAMGIRLVRGRYFTEQDTRTAAPVVIVDETLVRKLFPNEEPLGKRITFEMSAPHGESGSPQIVWREIVGVVVHVRHYGLASEPPYVQLYTPFQQLPIYFDPRRPSMALVVRTSLPPESLIPAIRQAVASIDRDIPVYGVQTMQTYLAQSLEQPRLSVTLLSGLGGLALILAVIGIYGVVSYSVAQRTQEIGVRMALGASRRDVLSMVVRQAVVLIASGVVIGSLAALALGSYIRSMLYQVSERDPWTLGVIALVLAATGLIASLVPARRATRVDPLVALRAE